MEGWIGNGLISGCDFRMVGLCGLMLDVMVMVMVMTGWGSLGYLVGDQWFGWAVTGLKSRAPLYPMASTVWGHCEVKLKYLQGFESGVLGLQDVVRSVIRDSLNPK